MKGITGANMASEQVLKGVTFNSFLVVKGAKQNSGKQYGTQKKETGSENCVGDLQGMLK